MKKLLALYSAICLFGFSSVYSNQFSDPYAGSYDESYPKPCVGQCANHYSKSNPYSNEGRFYAGAFGGANWLHCNKVHGCKPKAKMGWAGALSLGYKFSNSFRCEGEVAYRRNRLDTHDLAKGYTEDKISMKGSTHSWSYMGNVLYDFDSFCDYCPNVVPYVGMGIGYTQLTTKADFKDSVNHEHIKGKDSGFAWQGIAGLGYAVSDDTTVAMEYRFFDGRNHAQDHSVGLALRQGF